MNYKYNSLVANKNVFRNCYRQ